MSSRSLKLQPNIVTCPLCQVRELRVWKGTIMGISICVDMNNMNKMLEIHEADSLVYYCQPAAEWMDINGTLKQKGIPLFFRMC
ncbi:hypothetical protein K443DRAFT_685240 [Laccaria amethystina LaAM-08-1]|uniref:Uncharacterized protein n=1 Tax=Laccaria amethystina LaAM-08-1 TaxID=1095629 RepID=A0A0C9X461_9AGAR|nr:hypothetical protein K443DRAFT_685240 [Laccaria amethystina LaAM-08-1]